MSQYYTDFSEYTSGTFPSDWTGWLNDADSWRVEYNATHDKNVIYPLQGTNARRAITWDLVPLVADVEVYYEIASESTYLLGQQLAALRLDPDANEAETNNATLYRLGVGDSDNVAGRYVTGTFTALATDDNGVGGTSAVYSVRVQAIGSALRVKMWLKGDAEPGTWSIDTTDTAITAAGHTGLFRFTEASGDIRRFRCLAFGVGTGGDSAPTEPVSGTDVNVTGVAGTAAAGSVSVSTEVNLTATGVAGTAAVGSVSVSTGGSVDVNVTGVAGTAAVGSATVTADANVSATGAQGIAATTGVGIAADAGVSVTGVAATGQVGSASLTADANVSPTGVNSTAAIGSVSISTGGEINVPVTGVASTAAIGAATVSGAANVSPTGVSSTAAVGTVSVNGATGVSIAGVAATAAVGQVSASALTRVFVTGVQATAGLTKVLIWSTIPDTQDPNWQPAADAQTPGWQPVSDSQSPGWTDVTH